MTKSSPQFKAFDPKAEVSGRTMLSAINCINHENISPVLKALDLENIDPDSWYSQQAWLDVLKGVNQQGNAMFDFVALGIETIRSLPFPPRV